MGMETMFTEDAEFDNIADPKQPVQVSKIIHKAFIEITEKGTEPGPSSCKLKF